MFTKEELQALSIFLKRAQISGAEAVTVVVLQQKIAKLLSENKGEATKKQEENKK